MKKRWLSVFLVVLILLVPTLAVASSIPDATSNFYVNDFAGIFSEEQVSLMFDEAVKFAETSDGVQVVVTTIKSTDGVEIGVYATEMYNKYGIGKNDMGILILLATEDRDIWVAVGTRMEAYITDSMAGRLIDKYAIPSLKKNKFAEGIINLQKGVITTICDKLEIKSTPEVAGATENTTEVITTSKSIEIDFEDIIIGLMMLCIFIESCSLVTKNNINKLLEDKVERLENERSNTEKKCAECCYEKNLAHEKRIEKYTENLRALEATIKKHERFEEYVRKVHSDIDEEIAQKKEEELVEAARKRAKKFDKENLPEISRKNVQVYKELIKELENADKHLKRFVTVDIAYLKAQLAKCEELQKEYEKEKAKKDADEFNVALKKATSQKLSESECDRLIHRYNGYNLLTRDLIDLVNGKSMAMVNKTKEMYREERRKEERRRKKEEERRKEERRRQLEEEEEERRRRARYSSSSSTTSSSHSSFSGFGGHSSGGGAGRHF